jgi:putative oxidoreductase
LQGQKQLQGQGRLQSIVTAAWKPDRPSSQELVGGKRWREGSFCEKTPSSFDESMKAPSHTATAPSETCVICMFQNCYRLLIKAASLLQSPLLLALRLYWGWQFFQDGKGKLMNHAQVAGYFQSWHVPFPSVSVYLASSTECFGGLLLLAGLGSRLVCLPLIFTMIVAYGTAEIDKVKNIFSDPDKFVTADPFLYMLACLVVLAFGPGKFSIDWLLSKKFGKEKP